jgi:hypothetical protein
MKTAVEYLAYVYALQGAIYQDDIDKAIEIEKEQSLNMPTYNLDDLADEYCTHEPRNIKELRDVNLIKLGFRDGFQKAIELLTFKK